MEGELVASEHIERVRVTNGNPFQINDRHDGVPYEFPAGKTVIIPLEAATHIFGFPGDLQDMHAHMARRFGWNRPEYYKPDDNSGILPWQRMTALIRLAVEHYEVRRIHQPGAPIPAEEADEAPDMLGLNIDPPAPRRSSVGRGGRRRGSKMKRVLRPRTPAPAAEPAPLEAPGLTQD